MALDDKVEKVKAIEDSEEPGMKIEEPQTRNVDAAGNKERFDSVMLQERKDAASTQAIDNSRKPSLMEEVRDLNHKADLIRRNPKGLVAQAHEVIGKIEELKDKLSTPNLEIKSSVQTLLRSKLSHIDENLQVALSKAGVEYTPPVKNAGLANPVERFLGFLTHAQHSLATLGNDVESMHLNGKDLNPGAMLAIQIKVGYVQQEVEFFTSLLNKALESTKTIMNVQI